jgi:hypothetical protein
VSTAMIVQLHEPARRMLSAECLQDFRILKKIKGKVKVKVNMAKGEKIASLRSQ